MYHPQEGRAGALPYPTIDESLCQLCRRCLVMRSCKGMAIVRFDREEAPVVDAGRCQLCWACLPACPFGAVGPAGSR